MSAVVHTAIVHDWLLTLGGGERTLAAIYEIYPSSIYTLLESRKPFQNTSFAHADIHSSFLQYFPFVERYYRHLLPLYPLAIESLDVSGFDLVLSTSHAVAKGILTHSQQLHLCYCFTPMRYAWDLNAQYLKQLSPISRAAARPVLHYLRNWDITATSRVDHFIAISHYIAKRIQKTYGKKAAVIYPPVDVDLIPYQEKKEDFYLTVSRLVPYKRIDLLVETFSHLKQPLVIIGDGPEAKQIEKKARGNVTLLGEQPDHVVRDYLGRAKGFLFAAEEDFGIAPVEAQAAGTPVIALGKGGALETIIPERTGLFFPSPTVPSLIAAIQAFEKKQFISEQIREHALQFSKTRFQQEFNSFIAKKLEEFYEDRHPCRR